ncbi:MAG: hypothetical protein ACYCW6_12170 [Candidatus Xenobia bacterium]
MFGMGLGYAMSPYGLGGIPFTGYPMGWNTGFGCCSPYMWGMGNLAGGILGAGMGGYAGYGMGAGLGGALGGYLGGWGGYGVGSMLGGLAGGMLGSSLGWGLGSHMGYGCYW